MARVAQLRLELIAAAETVEGSDCCDGLHGGGGAHELTFVVTEDGGIGIEVINHHSNL